MFILDVLAWLVLFFLVYYTLLQMYIIASSFRGRVIEVEKRAFPPKYEQNINVIVYSHNDESTITELVESFKRQNYDRNKYTVNVILDNCTDNSAKMLEILGGTRIWRLNTDVRPVGRYKAIAWLLERVLSTENTNSFVFINADMVVKPDFLSRVNAEISHYPVMVGEVLPIQEFKGGYTGLYNLKNKIKSGVINHGRYYSSLSNILEGDLCAIRQDILEKINFSQVEKGYEEYEYSIKLSQGKIRVAYTNAICAYRTMEEDLKSVAIKDYNKRSKNLKTFRNNFAKMVYSRNLTQKELIFSLIYPSTITYLLLCLAMLVISSFTLTIFSTVVPRKLIAAMMLIFLATRFFTLFNLRYSFNEYMKVIPTTFLEPSVYFMSMKQRKSKQSRKSKKSSKKLQFPLQKLFCKKQDFTSHMVPAVVTDGKRQLNCQIEIREYGDKTQAVFCFKDKKMASSKHTAINSAMQELSDKLKARNFNLRVCLNCGYVDLKNQITVETNGAQACCAFRNINAYATDTEQCYIWDSCNNIALKEV